MAFHRYSSLGSRRRWVGIPHLWRETPPDEMAKLESLYRPLVPYPMKAISHEAISLLFKYLPISKQNPSDIAARQKLQIAAWMSLWPATLSKPVFVLPSPNFYHSSVDGHFQLLRLISRFKQTGGRDLRRPSRYRFCKHVFRFP